MKSQQFHGLKMSDLKHKNLLQTTFKIHLKKKEVSKCSNAARSKGKFMSNLNSDPCMHMINCMKTH